MTTGCMQGILPRAAWRVEPDLGLGFGEPFTEHAIQRDPVGQDAGDCSVGKALQGLWY